MQVLYLGRAPRTKETLPNFCEKCRVARHSRVFRGLMGSQRTPQFRGVTYNTYEERLRHKLSHLSDDEWRWLINFWGTPKAKVNIMIFFH